MGSKQSKRQPKKITSRYLYNAGLYYLQRFPASANHFRTVMGRKITRSCRAHPDQDAESCTAMLEDVVAQFIELGLLNDELYTQGMVTSLRRAGKSERAIISKLQMKGIPGELIKKHLKSYDEHRTNQSQSAEMEAAMTFARKRKIGPYARIAYDAESYKKDLAKMARAGFSYDVCQKILAMPPTEQAHG